MSWNYRVMRHSAGEAANDEPFYAVHEVHYDKNGTVNGWTVDAVGCAGETVAELSRDIAWYLTALVKPVLDAKSGQEVEPAQLLEDDIYAILDAPEASRMRDAIRNRSRRAASVDTHPKGGDGEAAPAPLSGAVPPTAGDAQ